ncbi:MAG TPA: hypothetical protein VHP81_03645, partial [Lachnospiraceae bacterium]|nr:hypothetical protein [Lachnospiraceae bacterium]
MEITALSFGLGMSGNLFGDIPVQADMAVQNNIVIFQGKANLKEEGIHTILKFISSDLSDKAKLYTDEIFGSISADIVLMLRGSYHALYYQSEESLSICAANKGDSAALLITYQPAKSTSGGIIGIIMNSSYEIAHFLGIDTFQFFIRKGSDLTLQHLIAEKAKILDQREDSSDITPSSSILRNTYDFLIYTKYKADVTSILGNAIQSLFGIDTMELFLGIQDEKISAQLTIPDTDNSILRCTDTYIGIQLDAGSVELRIHGSLYLKCIEDLEFGLDCSVGLDHFTISATVTPNPVIHLLGPVSLGETTLSIGVNAGISFGLLTNLYIRELTLFGAVSFVYNTSVEPSLISAAISDLSLSTLIRNLIGLSVDNIEEFDIIKILGFELSIENTFSQDDIKDNNKAAIVQHFNSQPGLQIFTLNESSVDTIPLTNGLQLIDKSRMSHFLYYQGLASSDYSYYQIVDRLDCYLIDFGQ